MGDEGLISVVKALDLDGWNVFDAIESALKDARSCSEADALGAAGAEAASLLAGLMRATSGRGLGLEELRRSRLELSGLIGQRSLPFAVDAQVRQLAHGLQRLEAYGGVAPTAPTVEPSRAVRIPAPLLFQIRRSIFPAERMMVGAARRVGGGACVEAVFDVTGRANPGHVDADPDKLMAAFVDMEHTGAFFALWAHSHPGDSPAHTQPSAEDRGSYRDRRLAGDSASLVGAVFCGRWIRFFGDSADDVVIEGEGVARVQNEENLYELVA